MTVLNALCGLILLGMAASTGATAPWQQPFSKVLELPSRDPDFRHSYGTSPEQFAEVWLPENTGAGAPLVVLIHGGCWLEAYDVSHVRPLATRLASEGLAVWALEYRRVGQDGGGWPGTFLDIADGVDALKTLELESIDTARTVFAGHSAGGHLALWAAGRDRLRPGQELHRDGPFAPRGVIGLAAITDLAAYAEGENSCQQVAPRLMGGSARQQLARYQQASPVMLGASVPTVLLQGDADTVVPPDQAKALTAASVHIIEGAGHFDLIHPDTPAFDLLLAEIDRMLAP